MRHTYAFMHAITIIEPQGHVYEGARLYIWEGIEGGKGREK